MPDNFTFQEAHFNRIFPFYILINQDLMVRSNGNTLEKIYPGVKGKLFGDHFTIKRPHIAAPDFDALVALNNQLVVIVCNNNEQTNLRGQIDYLPDTHQLLFMGSPWFNSIEEVTQNKLSLHDFACHDSMTDLLHFMKTLENTNEDLRHLLKTVNQQKDELKNAYKEINDIALFPTQNPDPLMRINFAGDLLQNNPAAAQLDFFEIDEKSYRNDAFFNLIAEKYNPAADRWSIEASSGNNDYSFSCIPMKTEGYINIYGRDITQQKKDQQQLEILSLIIQQTVNAVIVTNASGKVEWINAAFEKVTGYKLTDIAGKSPGSFLQGKDSSQETIAYMRGQIRQAKPFSCEIYNYKKSGEGYWLRIKGQPIFDRNGKVSKFFAIEEDITAEKKAQEKIQAAASRMSSLIANLNAGILLENDDRSIALVNQHFCDIFNITASPDQLIGKDCSAASGQHKHLFKDPGAFVTRIEEILLNKTPALDEKLEMVDGRVMERDFIPIWSDGLYNGHLWVYTDITEKISTEKILEEQRKFYEEILDNIPADIAVFNEQRRFLYVNPGGTIDAATRKWIIGRTAEEHPELRQLPASVTALRRNAVNTVFDKKQLLSWEEQLPEPGGHVKHVLRNLYPLLNNLQEVKFVIGYGIDITHIKNIQQQVEESEKRYKDVVNNSLAIVTTHNLKGEFLSVNPMIYKLFGYTDEEIIGHSLVEFIPAQDRQHFNENYMSRIISDKQASGIIRFMAKNGTIIDTLYNNYLKEEPGKEPYVIGFAVDISDRIKAENELKIAKQETEELAQSKQNFLANMSHEIRTPMNAILGMSRQLQKTSLDEKQYSFLNNICNASENLLVIINDILDLSKISAGKLSLEQIDFEPAQVIGKVLQVMMHKAEEKGLYISNSFFDPAIAGVLKGDPYRLNQVLLNLVSNAIKFTSTGGVDIQCKCCEDSPTHQKIRVIVTDTGIGMDENFVKVLFRKFIQEDDSVSRKFGGTGLGMSICKELVELMNGEIAVESVKGVGTTVSFEILFERGLHTGLIQKNALNISNNILAGRKILVVDDNEMNRLVASMILEEYGAAITEAVNGEEAVNSLKKETFDLVLMDMQMPVMNGLEATVMIRKVLQLNIPVIACTANAIKGENQKCFDAGMNDYISKPFEETELLQIITRWLNSPIAATIKEAAVPPKKTTALYDLSKLTEIGKGNTVFVQKMIALFSVQGPASVKEIELAYANEDFAQVKAIAHRLKTSINNMGIASLKDDIADMEKNADVYQTSEKLQQLISRLNTVVNAVVTDLQNYPH